MLVHVFKDKQKNEESGYMNVTFKIQGVDLEGLIPFGAVTSVGRFTNRKLRWKKSLIK